MKGCLCFMVKGLMFATLLLCHHLYFKQCFTSAEFL